MITAPVPIPSYTQGFARCRADSAHPRRWEALAGAWMPPLGVTGDTLVDVSGYGNHGTLTNGPTWEAEAPGWAMNCVAASSTYVAVPDSPYINIQANQSYSFAVRFRTSQASDKRIFAKRDSASPSAGYFAFVKSSTGGTFTINFDVGSANAKLIGNTQVNDGEWHTAVARVQGEEGELWIDGALDVADSDPNFAAGCVSTTEMRIGAGTALLNYFNGDFAGLAIWKRALSAEEATNPFALFQPRRKMTYMIPAVGGPYRAATGQAFHTGVSAGQTFHTGQTAGQIDGRCG